MTPGGDGGVGGPYFKGKHHTEETKTKMSLDRTGEKNANYGNHRVMSEDEKQKHACPGAMNGMYGKQHSDESKEKSSKSHLGKYALSNRLLDKVIMVTHEEGNKIIAKDNN